MTLQSETATEAYLEAHGIDPEASRLQQDISAAERLLGLGMIEAVRYASRLRRRQLGVKIILTSLAIETPKLIYPALSDESDRQVGIWLSSSATAEGSSLNSALVDEERNPITLPETMAATDRLGDVTLSYQLDMLEPGNKLKALQELNVTVGRISEAIELQYQPVT